MIPNIDKPRLRLRNGVWHLRKQHQGKRFEVSLGTEDRAAAEERARDILKSMLHKVVSETWAERVSDGLTPPQGWLHRLWASAQQRGARGTTLSIDDLRGLALRSGGRCMVSGVPFVLGKKMHPFQPSIDRIRSGGNYTAANARLVCLSVNLCMNRWGEDVFRTLAVSVAARYMERIEAEHAVLSGGADAEKYLSWK